MKDLKNKQIEQIKTLINANKILDALAMIEAELNLLKLHTLNKRSQLTLLLHITYLKALCLRKTGQLIEATKLFEEIQRSDPSHRESLEQLIDMGMEEKNWAQTKARLGTLIAQHPYEAGYYVTMARLLEAEMSPESISWYEQALALNPNEAIALEKLARHQLAQENWPAAETLFKQRYYLEIQKKQEKQEKSSQELLKLIGLSIGRQGRYTEAQSWFLSAHKEDPNDAECLVNLAILAKKQFNFSAAETYYLAALKIQPDYAYCQFSLSLMQLSLGQFDSGFKNFNARKTLFPPKLSPHPELLRWQGESLAGKTLYILPEWGYGDYVQFIRFSYQLKSQTRGNIRIIAVHNHRLNPLLTNIPYLDRVIDPDTFKQLKPQDPKNPDYQIYVLDLGELLHIEPKQLPGPIPYLFPSPIDLSSCKLPVTEGQKKLKIGLNWLGGPLSTSHAVRDCPWPIVKKLLTLPNTQYFALNFQLSDTERQHLPNNLIDLTQHILHFGHTAAYIAQCDLIISTDTALVHLAGGMGKPCWVLLSHDADWRWQLTRQDSPWYPSLRLFRASDDTPTAWEDVIDEVMRAFLDYFSS
jgi:tetratricopeptide (TPR) repeat protein